jgi:hypothetical protein
MLAHRDPDYGSCDDDYDDFMGAIEAQRLHELRGLIMAQVAEIEDLLRFTLTQTRTQTGRSGSRSRPSGRITAGAALKQLERLLQDLQLAERYQQQVALIRSTIRRRNQLVHARVHIGFAQAGEYAPREPVIALLLGKPGEAHEPVTSPGSPESVGLVEPVASEEISEVALEQDLEKAYEALDAALDIEEALRQGLR